MQMIYDAIKSEELRTMARLLTREEKVETAKERAERLSDDLRRQHDMQEEAEERLRHEVRRAMSAA